MLHSYWSLLRAVIKNLLPFSVFRLSRDDTYRLSSRWQCEDGPIKQVGISKATILSEHKLVSLWFDAFSLLVSHTF